MAALFYEILMKPAFLADLAVIPDHSGKKIMGKIRLLHTNPTPDSKNKRRLKGKRDLYRLRVGDYRVVYSFGNNPSGLGIVTLYGVDSRASVYEDGLPDPEDPVLTPQNESEREETGRTTPFRPPVGDTVPSREYLAIKFTVPLLKKLGISEKHFDGLCRCETVDDLLELPLSNEEANVLITVALEPDWEQREVQPNLVVGDPDDLVRYAEGELITFLLKLDPEQEVFVRRAMHSQKPMLVKGGPGTGKSTIALYRIKETIAALRAAGIEQPRILLATYTNALRNSSTQQLEKLLGSDVQFVNSTTVDRLVKKINRDAGTDYPVIEEDELKKLVTQCKTIATLDPDPERARRQRNTLLRLDSQYLIDEFNWVIDGRDIGTKEAYLNAPRAGRGVPLNEVQREAVWNVYQCLQSKLSAGERRTFAGLRLLAAKHILTSKPQYDAVFIDEAQDLEPVALRMLVNCCKDSSRLFVTADANQSIYGSTFRWADVHADLKFRGKTGILNTNHRSTLQIDRAARAYLDAGVGAINEDDSEHTVDPYTTMRFVNTEGARPRIRNAAAGRELGDLLATAIRATARENRIGYAGCAVLVPMKRTGEEIKSLLVERGIPAEFVEGKDLDLRQPKVKVIKLQSSKGLEFPFVAIAGFLANFYPNIDPPSETAGELGEEDFEERIARARRSIYVGMTRAMRELMVVVPPVPTHGGSPLNVLYKGFSAEYWNTGTN